jgi:hypothetical protein
MQCVHTQFHEETSAGKGKRKGKGKVVLCLTKHHNMKAYWGVEA